MSLIKTAIVAFPLTFFLAACAPATFQIYRPEAKGGKLNETMCRYNSGPGKWDQIEFNQDEIKIQISASNGAKGFSVNVNLLIPEGISVNASSQMAILYMAESGKKMSLQATEYGFSERDGGKGMRSSQYGIEYQSFDIPMVGRTFATDHNRTRNMSYFFSFRTSEEVGENFEVELPDILANGKSIKIPKVSFHKEEIRLLVPINC